MRDDDIDWTRRNPDSADNLAKFRAAQAHVVLCACGGHAVLHFVRSGQKPQRLGAVWVEDERFWGHRGLFTREQATNIATVLNSGLTLSTGDLEKLTGHAQRAS